MARFDRRITRVRRAFRKQRKLLIKQRVEAQALYTAANQLANEADAKLERLTHAINQLDYDLEKRVTELAFVQ